MGSDDNANKTKADPPKRRACDECRAKKLACSKELDGCGRCKREGIKCVYSVQKQMGRPRKRAHDEVEPAPPPPQQQQQQADEHTHIIPPFDPALTNMELDMSFLDFDGQDMTFFDYLDSVPLQDQDGPPAAKKQTISPPNPASNAWVSDLMLPINFDDMNAPPPEPKVYEEVSREDIEHIMAAEIPEKLPSLSPAASYNLGSATSPSETTDIEPPSLPDPPVPRCACLSMLYLALDSLQHLPTDVTSAMRVARTAARSAHDAVVCQGCGNPPLEYGRAPNILAFQSLMMLGALLPSIANAYTRILAMIDAEAIKADKEHRKIRLALDEYGGLWGGIAAGFNMTADREKLTSEPLEPSLWRLTIRSLLKLDVYGMHASSPNKDMVSPDCCTLMDDHPGLKDIIGMVEERSRKRHQQLDMALAAGLVVKPNDCPYDIGDEPPCMKIINIAKRSMNDLVIP